MDALKEESEIIYDFCLCNPPFFANQLEAKGVNSEWLLEILEDPHPVL